MTNNYRIAMRYPFSFLCRPRTLSVRIKYTAQCTTYNSCINIILSVKVLNYTNIITLTLDFVFNDSDDRKKPSNVLHISIDPSIVALGEGRGHNTNLLFCKEFVFALPSCFIMNTKIVNTNDNQFTI